MATELQINKLYNTHLGRDASFGAGSEYDADYWKGKSEAEIVSGIQSGSEWKNRKALIDSGITDEATLDKMVTVGGVKTDMHKDYADSGKSLYDFNKGNTWIEGIEKSSNYDPVARDYNVDVGAIHSDLGTSAAQDYLTLGTSNQNNNNNNNNNNNDNINKTTPITGGLTLDDLNKWWDTKKGNQTDSFDQFMKFMTALNGMGGMFGGSNVPGFASGGVAAASPYNNFMGFMNAFKSLGGDNSPAITTGNQNV